MLATIAASPPGRAPGWWMKYTTYSGFQAIVRAMEHYGIAREAVIDEHGIALPEIADSGQHISPKLTEQLLRLAVTEIDDAAFPLKVAEFISPSTFGEFSLGLLTSSSLRNFLTRLTKYYPYIATTQKLRLVRGTDEVVLLSHFAEKSIDEDLRSVWTEVTLAFVFRFMRLMGRPDYKASKIELTRPFCGQDIARYRDFFGVEPTFGASRNAMHLPLAGLDEHLANGGSEIAIEYELRIADKISAIEDSNLPLRVHALLVRELPRQILSKEIVASHFAMSPKTFQNRLGEAGTSYQRLLDEARRELAELYLPFPDITLAEVADLVGYSDASNFCRAYKRWTGHVPRSD